MDNEKAQLGLLSFSYELAARFKSFNQYNQERGCDEEFFQNSITEGTFIVEEWERIRSIDENAVSIFGGEQLVVL